MKDRESENRDVRIKREIEELFLKLIILAIDDMDKFEQKKMKKKRPIKNTWYDWLINYISETISKAVGGFKDKVVGLVKTITPKDYVKNRI